MDPNSSDRESSIRETVSNPWGTYWDQEDGSDSGLALGMDNLKHCLLDSSTDFANLEDKDIAARAVAFVVNSTRKGVVPLCADIASILRAKRDLEQKLLLLKRQNECLRSQASSLRTSQCTSPVQMDHTTPARTQSRSGSSCSQCSGTNNNHSGSYHGYSKHIHSHVSRKPRHSSASSNESLQTLTTAIIHTPSDHSSVIHNPQEHSNLGHANPDSSRIVHNASDHTVALVHTEPSSERQLAIDSHERRNSLPEITSQPQGGLTKIRTHKLVSMGTQCQIIAPNDPKLEDQFRETVKMNSKLSEELGAARKEIEILKGRLKEVEMISLARQYSSSFHVENETIVNGITRTDSDVSEKSSSSLPVKHSHRASQGTSSEKAKPVHRTTGGQLSLPNAMPGCLCTLCESAEGTGLKTGKEVTRVTVNGKLQIQLDDYVVVKGERTGHIRYIGHLDKITSPSMVFVGLELDAPVGRHDGYFNNKRYFNCAKEHGIFVPIQEVVCVISRKHTGKKSKGSTSLQTKSSSESDTNTKTQKSQRSKQSNTRHVPTDMYASKSVNGEKLPNGYV